jgi:hypothetical protein
MKVPSWGALGLGNGGYVLGITLLQHKFGEITPSETSLGNIKQFRFLTDFQAITAKVSLVGHFVTLKV